MSNKNIFFALGALGCILLSGCGDGLNTSSRDINLQNNSQCISNNQAKDPACCAKCGSPVYKKGSTMPDGTICQTFPVCQYKKYGSCIQKCPNI